MKAKLEATSRSKELMEVMIGLGYLISFFVVLH